MNIVLVTFIIFISVICLLVFCVIYLTFTYRKLLEKYNELSTSIDRSEAGKKIKEKVSDDLSRKIDHAIEKASEEAAELISKNAHSVINSMKKDALHEMEDKQKAEERAVTFEFDEARVEVEKFKEQKMNEIKGKVAMILEEVTPKVILKTMDKEKQEKIVMEELENAKRSNLF